MAEEKKVNKNLIGTPAVSSNYQDVNLQNLKSKNMRGYTVYSPYEITRLTGRGKDGELLSWGAQQPLFYLTVTQREEIARLSSPVFSVVTSRMNRISAMDFNIVPKKNNEDQLADQLKSAKQIYEEYANTIEMKYIFVRAKMVNAIQNELPDVLPDLSNFGPALMRWKKRIQNVKTSRGEEIKAWMMEPNTGITWESYAKKVVYNLMVHGSEGTYKQVANGKLENFDSLPGGSVYPLRMQYFSSAEIYAQCVYGYEPQIFYSNEMMYMNYLPKSSSAYPMIPLECLIAMIAENLLFNDKMSKRADGTRPPDKLVIITNNLNPLGEFNNPDADAEVVMDENEQKRIEHKLSEEKKNGIITMVGNGATIVDLGGDNTLDLQNSRQKDIKSEVGSVFGATDMEMNLGGSENTSGRETSEEQGDIFLSRGVGPILKIIQTSVTKDIIPNRYGPGYMMEYSAVKNEKAEKELDTMKLSNGELTQNELREKYNKPTFDGDEYNKPKDVALGAGDAGASEINPLFTKQLK